VDDSSFNFVSVIIAAVAALIAAGAMVAAIRQAAEAKKARIAAETAEQGSQAARDESLRLTKDANDIAQQSLTAQQKTLPPAWSVGVSLGEHLVGFENQSSRTILVVAVSVEPAAAENLVSLVVPTPTRVEYGDLFQLRVNAVLGLSPKKAILEWHYEDDDQDQRTERWLPA
jgi:type II secretory pathway pseudopilin PulG